MQLNATDAKFFFTDATAAAKNRHADTAGHNHQLTAAKRITSAQRCNSHQL